MKKSSANVSKEDLTQSLSVAQGDLGIVTEGDRPEIICNPSALATVSDSSSPDRLSDLDMNGNIQPSGRMTTSAPVEAEKISAGDVDDSLHLTHPGNIKSMLVL